MRYDNDSLPCEMSMPLQPQRANGGASAAAPELAQPTSPQQHLLKRAADATRAEGAVGCKRGLCRAPINMSCGVTRQLQSNELALLEE